MKNIKTTIVIGLLCLFSLNFHSCTKEAVGENEIVIPVTHFHHNITVALDLSNRIKPPQDKPLKDEVILDNFLNQISTKVIKTQNRQAYQLDIVRVRSINKKTTQDLNISNDQLKVDFSSFENQMDRINYITSGNLFKDVGGISKELSSIYKTCATEGPIYGADIWSYLKNVSEYEVRTAAASITKNSTVYHQKYNNVLVIFTDGYLEYGKYDCDKGHNICPHLSQNRIKSFREAFKASGMSDLNEFFIKEKYGITPVNNIYLKDLKVVVMELEDRSLRNGNPTVFPTDLEIIKLFWKDWLVNSGVQAENVKLYPSSVSLEESLDHVLSFVK